MSEQPVVFTAGELKPGTIIMFPGASSNGYELKGESFFVAKSKKAVRLNEVGRGLKTWCLASDKFVVGDKVFQRLRDEHHLSGWIVPDETNTDFVEEEENTVADVIPPLREWDR